jgi:hypothetical protein
MSVMRSEADVAQALRSLNQAAGARLMFERADTPDGSGLVVRSH